MSVFNTNFNLSIVDNMSCQTLSTLLHIDMSYDSDYPIAYWIQFEKQFASIYHSVNEYVRDVFNVNGPLALRLKVKFGNYEMYKDILFITVWNTPFDGNAQAYKQFQKDVQSFFTSYINGSVIDDIMNGTLTASIFTESTYKYFYSQYGKDMSTELVRMFTPITLNIGFCTTVGETVPLPVGIKPYLVLRDFKHKSVDISYAAVLDTVTEHYRRITNLTHFTDESEVNVKVTITIYGKEYFKAYAYDSVGVPADIANDITNLFLDVKRGHKDFNFDRVTNKMYGGHN